MATGNSGTERAFDLSDPALYESGEALAVWRELRRTEPVYRVAKSAHGPFWAVLTHDLVTEALADPATYSSTGGMRIDADRTATAAGTGKMMVITDPPRHGKIRRIMASAFTPPTVARLRETMREIVVELVEAALDKGTCDFVEVAARLPLAVICDLLGVPRQDWDFMLSRTMTAFGVSTQSGPADPSRAAVAHTEIFRYYEELMARRRREPKDDIVSALVRGRIDGKPITSTEVVLNCNGLISGGNETTRHATLGGVLAFLRSPPQWALLRENPGLLPSAIHEVLRYTSPAMHLLRTTTRNTELGGRQLGAREKVTLWLASANRDERIFRDPDRFDITRAPRRHLTFAHGPHHCIGSVLATAELTTMFGELRDRVHRLEPAGPVRRMRSNLIGGIESLPVTLVRDTTAGPR
ncbi:cytochrome P450 [Amycolatopsis magusensis]|uniref:cytochrome P450 n=1 Tax=Amycolatopsis magusensis TaxID=882444 RepID=UPI003C30297D